MTYPAGVQLATLTFSNPTTFLGNPATRTEVTFQSSAGVVWAATGEPIDDFAETVAPAPGMPGSLTAPFVDQSGFTDQAGNTFTMWAYVVTRRTFFGSAVKTVRKNWQPVIGQDTVDFDNLPGGNVGLPVSAPIVPVTSVASLTGAVGAESLAGAIAGFIPSDVTPEAVAANLPGRLADANLTAEFDAKLDTADRGAPNGVAPLGGDQKVPDSSLPTRLQGAALNATYAPAVVGGKVPVRKDELTYNVKDYGAVGDGVTDDQPAIQALINSLRDNTAIKGATIFFPTATYALRNNLDLPTDSTKPTTLRLIGTGRGGSTLKALGTAAGFDALIRHPAPTPTWSGGTAHEIAFLSLDSNKVAKYNVLLTNAHGVHVHNCYGVNPALGAYSNLRIQGNGTDYLSWENVIENNRFEGGGGTDPAQWSDYVLEIASTDNHTKNNILVRGKVANQVDYSGNNFHFQNHAFYGARHFWQKGTGGSQFVQCEADGPDEYAFFIESNNTLLVGNRVFWPGTIPDAALGIYLLNPVTGCMITGNVIVHTDGAKKIVSAGRVDVSTMITNNVGATLDTRNQAATNFSVQYADANTTANGNVRGSGAADLQFGRSSGDQVAAGGSSFASGYGNRVDGFASSAIGSLNRGTATFTHLFGTRGSDRGTSGKLVLSMGQFAAVGDQQISSHVLAAATTGTAATRLTVGAQSLTFANTGVALSGSTAGAMLCNITLVGQCPTTGDAAYWTAKVLLRKSGSANSTTTIVGSPSFTAGDGTATALTATPTIAADTTYAALNISVAAPNSTAWHWVARVDTTDAA